MKNEPVFNIITDTDKVTISRHLAPKITKSMQFFSLNLSVLEAYFFVAVNQEYSNGEGRTCK